MLVDFFQWNISRHTIPLVGIVVWLVVLTIVKNMNGKDDIPYMKWNIENVPTTNQ
jgi:hypothetical protein